MTGPVTAPLDGTVVRPADVPDAVFSAELLGGGSAVAPPAEAGSTVVRAPVAGRLVSLHPHAFVVAPDGGPGVLVHVGIDTVGLHGQGFELHVAEGDVVERGAPVLTVDLAVVRAAGLSTTCPVVVLDSPAGSVRAVTGRPVRAGDPLFTT